MRALHLFDLDGTLLPGTTASREIARVVGCLPELDLLEAAWSAGAVDSRGFAQRLHALWAPLDGECVRVAFETAPWIKGLTEVLGDVRERGERAAVLTMSPDFFADRLLGLGAHEVLASRFPPPPSAQPPQPDAIMTPQRKVEAMQELCGRHGIGIERTVAYGDSGSDVPLFAALGNTVAVNATAALERLAAIVYRGEDLTCAYQLARGAFLDGQAGARP